MAFPVKGNDPLLLGLGQVPPSSVVPESCGFGKPLNLASLLTLPPTGDQVVLLEDTFI